MTVTVNLMTAYPAVRKVPSIRSPGTAGHCGICQDCGATGPDIAMQWDDPDIDVCDCYLPSKYKIGALWTGNSIPRTIRARKTP